jgi:hypothetical protein
MMAYDHSAVIHTTREYLLGSSDTQKYLTIFHEYQHVKQILQKRFVYLFTNQTAERVQGMSESELKRMAKEQFHSEFEAYWAECELSAELGVMNDNCEACRRGDVQGFKNHLAEFLALSRPYQPLVEGYLEAAQEE